MLSNGRMCFLSLHVWQRTWPVVLLPVFESLDESLRFAFVGPPVGNVWPQVAVTAGNTVFIGHNNRAAQPPKVTERQHFLKPKQHRAFINY